MIFSRHFANPWWRHQMEAFSALLAICAGNSPVTGEFPAQRQVTRSFDVFFHLHLNERLSKQSWGWWFETPSRPLWRHSNATTNKCALRMTSWRTVRACTYLWVITRKNITPVRLQWSYVFLALTHRYMYRYAFMYVTPKLPYFSRKCIHQKSWVA